MSTLSPPSSPPQSRERPRAVTSMSYASTHSHRSSRSREEKKLELVETSRDKRRLEGKADPMKALHEAQPAAVALEDPTLENVRALQFRDREGNIISDPDRSNPTRPRMERPLDTIRSFNAAAEGTTSRRSSYHRQPSQFNNFDSQSRRNSHYGSPNAPHSPGARGPPPRGQGGYYNRNNSYGFRPDQSESDYYQNQGQGQGHPRQQRFQPAPMNMETQMNMMQPQGPPLPQHAHQQSYETMNTSFSASNSDEMSKSTNPSSQNSSFDQLHQMGRKPDEYHNSHRQNGAPMRSQYPPNTMMNNVNNQHQWNGRMVDDYGMEINDRPVPPPKNSFMNGVREMAPVNGGRDQMAPGKGEKRQSWLRRTFSKRA